LKAEEASHYATINILKSRI
jgi:hypothetical protein